MYRLSLANLGPIDQAELEFADLTVLVGPQATGKSIALQVLKLLLDTGYCVEELRRYGLQWKNPPGTDPLRAFLEVYFGEGMGTIWRSDSRIQWEGNTVDLIGRLRARPGRQESVFFIPAQRVLTLRDGWPRPFTDFRPGDPFVVREFSERLRQLLESEFSGEGPLFPASRRLKPQIRKRLNESVFRDFELKVDSSYPQKRLVLHQEKGKSLPAMVWSAGQREFVPLLAGLYWLIPGAATSMRKDIRWAVVEELEMGLHPRAVSAVMLTVCELLSRGYRVCLSTHSPQVLDVVWAIQKIRQSRAPADLVLKLFEVERGAGMEKLAENVLQREFRVYYFDPETRRTRDITCLDPGSEQVAEAGWGGLTDFSGRTAQIVAEAVSAGGGS
jgi:hypothetical protein